MMSKQGDIRQCVRLSATEPTRLGIIYSASTPSLTIFIELPKYQCKSCLPFGCSSFFVDSSQITHGYSVNFDSIQISRSCTLRRKSTCPHRESASRDGLLRSELRFSLSLQVSVDVALNNEIKWEAFLLGGRKS